MKTMDSKERACANAVLRFEETMKRLQAPYVLAVAEDYDAETCIVSASTPTEETLNLIRDMIHTIAVQSDVNPKVVAQDIVKRMGTYDTENTNG